MENESIKIFLRMPFFYIFVYIGIIILSIFNIFIFNDIKILLKILSIFALITGLFLLLYYILRKLNLIGYIITKENIVCLSLFNKKIILWNQIISYNITGNEKKNDLILNFYTEESIKNKGILKSKTAIRITTKFHNININELIENINKLRGNI